MNTQVVILVNTRNISDVLPANIDSILSATGLRHTLHLYTPNVNKYALQIPFLNSTREDEKAVYITNESAKSVMREFEFKGLGIDISIINPKNIKDIGIFKNEKLKIVVDAGSLNSENDLKMEKYLTEKVKNHFILCTYDVSKLSPEMLKEIVTCHDKLMMTTTDVTIMSSESLDELSLSDQSIEKFVKNELETIVLALILRKPMCGTDIIKTIHKNFNVLLSPGTIYPLLHSLEERGLLKCEFQVKTKTYKPMKDAEPLIRDLLNKQVQASRFLSKFLQSTGLCVNY